MTARQIMSSPVQSVSGDCTLEQAARTMLDRNIGCLPVVDSAGKLIGILTESDFAAKSKGVPFSLYRFPQLFGQWLPKSGVEQMYAAARTHRVDEFMNHPVVTVDAADSIESVIGRMLKCGYHRLPVLDRGVPVGVIARRDLLKLILDHSASLSKSA